MRTIILALLTLTCLLVAFPLPAQTLLNNPESIVYDAPRHRYIVSNWGDGKLVQIDREGNESYYDTTFTRLAGLYILEDTLYVATNLEPYMGVAGFDLSTDELSFFIEMENSGLTNDITSDSANNIYVTDFYNSKLYKIPAGSRSYSTFVNEGLNWPNGIVYDRFHHRLLLISQHDTGGPILSVDIGDSTVGFVAMTGYSGVDGLEMDSDGRLYFSTWQTDQTLRFDADYAETPEVVIADNLDPADIYINPYDSTLCVPNFSRNDISFLSLATTEVEEHSYVRPGIDALVYPNPFNQSANVRFTSFSSGPTTVSLYTLDGRLVQSRQIISGNDQTQLFSLSGANLTSGTYILRLCTGDQLSDHRLTLLK